MHSQISKIILSMKGIQSGNLSQSKQKQLLLSSPIVVLFLCQLFLRLYCNSLRRPCKEVGMEDGERQRGWRRRIEGITIPAGTGVKRGGSKWLRRKRPDLFTTKGDKQLLLWTPIHTVTASASLAVIPWIPGSPCLLSDACKGLVWAFTSLFSPDNRHRMPLYSARGKTLVANSGDASCHINTWAAFLTTWNKTCLLFGDNGYEDFKVVFLNNLIKFTGNKKKFIFSIHKRGSLSNGPFLFKFSSSPKSQIYELA